MIRPMIRLYGKALCYGLFIVAHLAADLCQVFRSVNTGEKYFHSSK